MWAHKGSAAPCAEGFPSTAGHGPGWKLDSASPRRTGEELCWGRSVLGEPQVEGAAVRWRPQAIWATGGGAGPALTFSSKP